MSIGSLELDRCIERLYNCELLPEVTVEALCLKAKELLVQDLNVVLVSTPVTVVGDIHGQFHDLVEIFRIGGYAPDTNYLFLGDYVDRGMFLVETITLLICLKLRYPQRVLLVRGNHELRQVTQNYGFYTECLKKYGSARTWAAFTEVFDYMLLAVVVDDAIFCVHGGLLPSVQTIDQIRVVDRFKEIPHEGIMADLVWSDPDDERGDFSLSPRGAGYTFGVDVVRKFLEVNGCDRILRAHQLCNDGYQNYFDGLVTTVWLAPNYCYRCGNRASVLELYDRYNQHFNVFDAAPENDEAVKRSMEGEVPAVVEYFL